jgi:hypothetical protein
MADSIDSAPGDPPALLSFAAQMDDLADSLTPREKALLDVLLYRALSPVQQARARGETDLLTSDELAFLRGLDRDRP